LTRWRESEETDVDVRRGVGREEGAYVESGVGSGVWLEEVGRRVVLGVTVPDLEDVLPHRL
jgi:hypothetical protein